VTDKVDRLAREEEALAARLKSLRDERLREEKRLEARRTEVVGSLILKGVAEGELETSWLHALLRKGLIRKTDRALFDLEQEREDENVEMGLSDDENLELGEDDEDDLDDLEDVQEHATLTER